MLAIAITVIVGIAMGAINNLAGGAGVLGLIVFEYVWGLPLAAANPSTRIAAVAIVHPSTVQRVYRGGGTVNTRARVSKAAKLLELPEPPPAGHQEAA